MTTVIGQRLPSSMARRYLVLAAALFIAIGAPVISRWWVTQTGRSWVGWTYFRITAVVGALTMGAVCRWDRRSLGLTLSPLPSFRYWWRIGMIGGLIVLAGTLAAVLAAKSSGPDPFGLAARTNAGGYPSVEEVFSMLVLAPVFEEIIYRLVLCTALMGVGGSRAAIVGGGLGFAWLHWSTGALGPDNLLAGFFFSWAFVRSGTISIPIAFHSIGNFGAIILGRFIATGGAG